MKEIIDVNVDLDKALNVLSKREKDLNKYLDTLSKNTSDEAYQKNYNSFYKVSRRGENWRKSYYSVFKKYKDTADVDFETLLNEICKKTNRVEASFTSKMLHTINPEMPIWDSLVLKQLNIAKPNSKDINRRKAQAIEKYIALINSYDVFLNSKKSKKWIKEFDKKFASLKDISGVKKVDFILWANGQIK